MQTTTVLPACLPRINEWRNRGEMCKPLHIKALLISSRRKKKLRPHSIKRRPSRDAADRLHFRETATGPKIPRLWWSSQGGGEGVGIGAIDGIGEGPEVRNSAEAWMPGGVGEEPSDMPSF